MILAPLEQDSPWDSALVCEPGEDHHLVADEDDPMVNIYLQVLKRGLNHSVTQAVATLFMSVIRGSVVSR